MLRPFGAVPLSVPETLGRYCQKAWGAGDKNKSCLLHTAMTGRVDTERCAQSPGSLCETPPPHQTLGWEYRDT